MKKIIAGLVVIVVALVYFTPIERLPSEVAQRSPIVVKEKAKKFDKERVDRSRMPSSAINHASPKLDLGVPKENDKENEQSYKHSYFPGLPRGYELVSDVYAIKDQDHFQFIESDGRVPGGANVAVNLSTGRLAPISSVLKILNVSEAQRRKLMALGYVEHVYQPELKILFIETQHENVLEAHSNLTQEGYESKIEVLRHYNRTR